MKMKKTQYLLNLDYNQEQRKISNAVEQLTLLYHMLDSDSERAVALGTLLSAVNGYRALYYPDTWRPENQQQEERPWDSEVE